MRKAVLILLSGILILQMISIVQASSGGDPRLAAADTYVADPARDALPSVQVQPCPDPTPGTVVKVIRCLNKNISYLQGWINKTFIRCSRQQAITRFGTYDAFGYEYNTGTETINVPALDYPPDKDANGEPDKGYPHLHFLLWSNACQHA